MPPTTPRNVDHLSGIHSGETVWVLGNGPSLKEVDFSTLDRDRTIGVNRILGARGKKGYDPRYIVFVDPAVWEDQAEAMLASDAELVTSENFYRTVNLTRLARPFKHKLPTERVMTFTSSIRAALYSPVGAFYKGSLTGYYAASLAARMVFPEGTVVLAGMDLSYPANGSKETHFFGEGKTTCSDAGFPMGVLDLTALRDALVHKVDFRVFGHSRLLEKSFKKFSKNP